MKESSKKKINNSVVRIVAEKIDINWHFPFNYNKPIKGSGTGFFISSDLIVTCAHVIDGSRNLYIEIPNYLGNRKINCVVVGIVPEFDIGLLQCIGYKSKDIVKIGNSDTLKSGDEVIAVGYPMATLSFNEKNNLKYTKGIVSGQQKGLIQVDSAINPGNSGGPLFYKDVVMGINSMKLINSGLDNIGYSVPINNFKIVQEELLKMIDKKKKDNNQNNFKNKIVFRPNLLFEYNNTTPELVKKITCSSVDHGVIISNIYDQSIFKNTELKEGMILVEFNKIKISNYGMSINDKWIGTNIHLSILCDRVKNNQKISMKVYDGKKKINILVILKPFSSPTRKMYPSLENIPYIIISGIILMNFCENHYVIEDKCIRKENVKIANKLLTPHLKIEPSVYVTFIIPNSKVNILGNIKEGQFIKKVNDLPVTNLETMNKALHKMLIINGEKYVKIENDIGKIIMIPLNEILEEDLIFSKLYNYPLNGFHKKYMKKINDK